MAGFSLMGEAVHAARDVGPPAAWFSAIRPLTERGRMRMIAFSRQKPTQPAARVCFDAVKAA
jgi:hypothetical protein